MPLRRPTPEELSPWQRAFEASAGLSLRDLHFVESHDCFTIAELMEYEAMGLTPPGRAHVALDEGWVYKGGKLPINPSGGLIGGGHPVGATGGRILATLLREMDRRGARYGVETMCIGGGQGIAVVLERT